MSYFICKKDEHCIDCPKNYPEEECEHWIEVEEVKYGHWIDAREQCSSFVCSKCEYQSRAQYNFCPECGVKMKEEKNDVIG